MSGERKDVPNPKPTKPLRRVKNRVVEKVKDAEDRARQSERTRVRASLYVWRLSIQVISQWRGDRCPQQAAGLSFQSVLSVVPALALAMAAFRATGLMEAESSLIKFLASEYLPLSEEEISEKLLSLSENITFESMGLVGLITTLLIAFFTFNSLEQTINHIWRVEKRRSFFRRLIAFYLTATIGSVMVGLSLYQAAQFGLTDGWSGVILSVLIAFGAIFLANYFLPNTKVRIKAAIVGALVTTFASEIAKLAFAAYVTRFAMDRYSGIYGTLAAVPLCLVWIYWSWLMLLLGVEVSHSVQNLRLLEGSTRRVHVDLAGELERSINGRTGARIVAAIASAEAAGESGLSRFRLSHDFALSADAIRIITTRLRDAKILSESTSDDLWSLTGPATDITVLDVFDAFRGTSELESLQFEESESTENLTYAEGKLAELVGKNRDAAQSYSIAHLCDNDPTA
ncbi:MAG: YihY/virulence factor BrkB family protein [Myxococcales bacterium]|nr:YihY/virulence factor BrkB family protein [Myxococcales bacterium]